MRNEMLFIILGMAAVTYLTRFSFIFLFRYIKEPGKLDRWIKHVPTSVLTVMIVPALILPEGHIDLSLDNRYLFAGIVSALVAWKTRNIFITMFSGMAVILFYIFQPAG